MVATATKLRHWIEQVSGPIEDRGVRCPWQTPLCRFPDTAWWCALAGRMSNICKWRFLSNKTDSHAVNEQYDCNWSIFFLAAVKILQHQIMNWWRVQQPALSASRLMAVASGLAGPVLAGEVLTLRIQTAHARTIKNQVKNYRSPAHCSPVQTLDYPKYKACDYQSTLPPSLRRAYIGKFSLIKYFAGLIFVSFHFVAVTRQKRSNNLECK